MINRFKELINLYKQGLIEDLSVKFWYFEYIEFGMRRCEQWLSFY